MGFVYNPASVASSDARDHHRPDEPKAAAHDDVDESGYLYRATRLMVRRPALMSSCCFVVIIVIVAIGAAGNMLGITESGEYDWTISSTSESEELDAYESAVSQVDPLGGAGAVDSFRTEIDEETKLYFIYETRDKSEVFDPVQLQQMCRAEALVATDPRFPDFCRFVPGTTTCEIPTTSVVQYFYNFSSAADWDCETLLSEEYVRNATDALYAQVDTAEGFAAVGPYLSNDFRALSYSRRTQSVWYFSLGSDSFLSADDGSVAALEESLFTYFDINDNADGLFPYYPSPYREEVEEDNLEFIWWALTMRENAFSRLVTADLNFAIFSFAFVLLYMRFHIGNCFTATVSILQIVLSIPLGLVLYRGIYQIPFWQELHSLVIFITLGIGADDVFVYVDAWKQSIAAFGERRDEETLHRRLYHAFVHTAQAVFNTSFTTAFAFIATGFSPLMPISTFGFYAATVIVLNYVFVMTLTPSVTLLGERYFGGCACSDRLIAAASPRRCVRRGPRRAEDAAVNPFVENYYLPFMTYSVEVKGRRVPVTALAFFFGLLAFGIFSTTQALTLEPPTELEDWFPTDHMFTRAEKRIIEAFLSGDDNVFARVNVAFGITGIDRGGFDPFKPNEDRGSAEFDPNFDLSHPSCQAAFLRACDDVETFACAADVCQPLGTISRPGTLKCFMRDFQTWAQDTHGEDTLALASDAFYARLEEFRNTQLAADGSTFEENIGFIGGALRFASFSVTSNMENLAATQDKADMLDAYKDYVASVEAYDVCGAGACSCAVQQTSDIWTWYRTEIGLVIGFYQGLAISLPVAFAVLIFATGNFVLAFYAILSVVFIVMGVLGFVSLLGWSLGVAEAVAGVIVVGFSVDYTLHLAHVYEAAAEEGYSDRVSRFEVASRKMIVTVIAGALTTGGSSLPLFGAQLVFFNKMATLILSTITLSYFYALGWFMSALYLFGPEGDFGKLKLAERFARARGKCSRR